jgi:hypothetical protein
VPAHIVLEGLAAIDTLTGRFGFTVIVTVFDVAGFPVAQVALDVNTQVTKFPLVRVVLENVEEFIPTFTPFSFH